MSDDTLSAFPRVPPAVFEDAQFLKKYELERELGVGGAGVVVCARHRELDERVAIKFLLSESENAEAVARFRREARAAHRVKSEHVVGIVDVSTTTTGVPYVVMEYLEGTDLERMLLESPDGQLPVRDAIEFVLQACEALAECHAIGIVHRDLKPSNLFCTHGADGLPIIKVLDFGISKLGTVTVDEAMTGRHAIMGSPRYMSPEQFATPTDVDRRADIWGLGIILYELVTGTTPFMGNTVILMWEQVKTVIPEAVEELRRDAPRALGPIVLRCLEKDRAKRFQNVAELAKALLPLAPDRMRATVARIVRIVEMPGVTTASLSLPPSGRPSTNGATSVSVRSGDVPQRGIKNLGLVLLLAAGAIGLVLVTTRRSPESEQAARRPSPSATPTALSVVRPPFAALEAPVLSVSPAPTLSATRSVSQPSRSAPAALAASTSSASSATAPESNPGPSAAPPGNRPRSPSAAGPRTSFTSTPNAAPAAVALASPPTTPANEALPASVTAAASAASPAAPGSGSPWIVDIVEQRKGRAGGTP